MKKVDNGIWEHKNFTIIKNEFKNYAIYKNQPITNNYQESELIEITDTLKQAQNYVRGY